MEGSRWCGVCVASRVEGVLSLAVEENEDMASGGYGIERGERKSGRGVKRAYLVSTAGTCRVEGR